MWTERYRHAVHGLTLHKTRQIRHPKNALCSFCPIHIRDYHRFFERDTCYWYRKRFCKDELYQLTLGNKMKGLICWQRYKKEMNAPQVSQVAEVKAESKEEKQEENK